MTPNAPPRKGPPLPPQPGLAMPRNVRRAAQMGAFVIRHVPAHPQDKLGLSDAGTFVREGAGYVVDGRGDLRSVKRVLKKQRRLAQDLVRRAGR